MKGPQASRLRGASWRAAAVALVIAGAAALVVSAHAQSPAALKTKQLRLVSTAWTPFTNPSGQPRFALDLVEAALHFFSVTRHVERIADCATNIAEDVIYLVEGEIARHHFEATKTFVRE